MSCDCGHPTTRQTSDEGGDDAVASEAVGADWEPKKLETIVAGIAHDLNNALTVVFGSLEQLRRQSLSELGKRQLSRAEWGTRQAASLCTQALSMASRKPTSTKLIDLNAAVEEFHEIGSEIAIGKITTKLRLSDKPLPIQVNAGGVEIALLSLLHNAIDAMPNGGTIIIETTQSGSAQPASLGTAEVSVTDTGQGMPMHAVSRATEPFFTTKEQGRGTGLGLWMVQQFVANANGKVVIETEEGRGTTVRLRFPLASKGRN